jgi:hypothetical protein
MTTTILEPSQTVTGVRAWTTGGQVVLTGEGPLDGAATALIYVGAIEPTAPDSTWLLTPGFSDVTASTFYGPDTAVFNPDIKAGEIRAVGTWQTSDDNGDDTGDGERNHGMIYHGPPGGGGSWEAIDVPGSEVGGATVWNTIPHSTMGNLVVGNYDLLDEAGTGNAFIYDLRDKRWQIFDLEGFEFTTFYGIWQNDPVSEDYIIVGGTHRHDSPDINRGLVIAYNAAARRFGEMRLYNYLDQHDLLTHFEGITAFGGGYYLAGQSDETAFLASITITGGVPSPAAWAGFTYPGAKETTGNTVYANVLMGIFSMGDKQPTQSYAATPFP